MTPTDQTSFRNRFGYFIRCMRNFLLVIITFTGFLALALLVGLTWVVSKPVDIMPLARYVLPITVAEGTTKDKPAGKLIFDKLTLYWPLLGKGFQTPISLTFKNLKIVNNKGQVADFIQQGKVELALLPLLKGKIVPYKLTIGDMQFRLKRDQDKQLVLDLPDIHNNPEKNKISFDLHHLKRLEIQNAQTSLSDEVLHKKIQINIQSADIQPFYYKGALGAIGHIHIQGNAEGHQLSFSAQSDAFNSTKSAKDLMASSGLINWNIRAQTFNPSDFAQLIPSLKVFESLNLPVSFDANFKLGARKENAYLMPVQADMRLNLDKGIFSMDNYRLFVSSGTSHAHMFFSNSFDDPIKIELTDTKLKLLAPDQLAKANSGPVFDFQVKINLSSLLHTQHTTIQLNAHSPELDFATLKNYWPSMVAKGAYEWVTNNMTHGTANNFRIQAGLEGHQGWKHLKLVSLSGGIEQANDLEVHWLRPVPPLQHMNAQMVFIDPDKLKITYQGGYQIIYPNNKKTQHFSKLAIPNGTMWITGLDNRNELGIIDAVIDGKLQDVLALLKEPRLRLLSKHPLTFTNPDGYTHTDLHIRIPLKKKVKIEQVGIEMHAELSDVSLGNVVLGRGLAYGRISLDANARRLEMRGKGILAHFPTKLVYRQDFQHRSKQDIIESAQIKSYITPKSLEEFVADAPSHLRGQAVMNVDYIKRYNGKGRVKFDIDLLKAGINFPIWNKPVNQPAILSGEMGLQDNKMIYMHNLRADGPELSVMAEAQVKDGTPTLLKVHSFRVNRSAGQATLSFPMTRAAINNPAEGSVRVSIDAETLDLAPFMKEYWEEKKPFRSQQKKPPQGIKVPIAATGKYDGPRGRHWVINVQAHKIYYKQDQYVRNVTTYMEYNGIRLKRLFFGMRDPTPLIVSLQPKAGGRFLWLESQDIGVLLNKFGIYNQISGGPTVIQGLFDDTKPSAPFKGSLHVGSFVVKNIPSALQTLSNLSIYGLFKEHNKNEMGFDAVDGEISLDSNALRLKNIRIHNAELGATMVGKINLNQAKLDLEGTIVPAYIINSLPGRIIGIGKLFSPEKEGGFSAATFDITGNFKNPEMKIHIFRILTPGILRKLF